MTTTQEEVNSQLNLSRKKALDAIADRDRRIAELEELLRTPRHIEGVILVGGPEHGTIKPWDVSKGRAIEVLLPSIHSAVYTGYSNTSVYDARIRVGIYRVQEVAVAETKRRYIAVYEGDR